MKLYKITDLYLDGDDPKHAQHGRILDERKEGTGISWWWQQARSGEQRSGYHFDGTDYTDWEACKAAYLAKVQP